MITTKRCPIFCSRSCSTQHHPLLIALINTNTLEDGTTCFTALEATINRYVKLGNWSICDDVDDPNPEYRYPLLHWASCIGKIPVVEWLVKKSNVCVFSRQLKTCDTALHSAIYSLQKSFRAEAGQVFSKLVPILAGSLACRNSFGDNPLHLVCRYLVDEKPRAEFFLECICHMLKFAETRGAGLLATIVNSQNNDGDTPIHILAQHDRNLNVIKQIVNYGKVDLNLRNSKDQNALQVAITLGQMKTAKYLHQLIEDAPKKRNGYIASLPKPSSFGNSSVALINSNDSSTDLTVKNKQKSKETDSPSSSSCKVTSTVDSMEESPSNSSSDKCFNTVLVQTEIEDDEDGSSPASNTTDSPSTNLVCQSALVSRTTSVTTSVSVSSSVEQSSAPTKKHITVGQGLPSVRPLTPQKTKLVNNLPHVCSSSVSSAPPTAETSSSTSKNLSKNPVIGSPSASIQSTSPPLSMSDNNCSPPPAKKKKKTRVINVKKCALPTNQMLFTNHVQFTSKTAPSASRHKNLFIDDRIENKHSKDIDPDDSAKQQPTNIKEEMDVKFNEICPDNNSDSDDITIIKVTSIHDHHGSTDYQEHTADKTNKGPGKALLNYLSLYGDNHCTAILTNLRTDRDDYQKQMEQLHTQIKAVEKEIKDDETEMEEKNSRLKDILLEVEQLQTRVFHLAKHSIGQKESLSKLKTKADTVNKKLSSCEKAIEDMS